MTYDDLPIFIVSNKNLALMNAIRIVFLEYY